MKKWLIPVGILFVLIIAAAIPVTQTTQLTINSSYFNVYRNLVKAQNWLKWYNNLKNNSSNIEGDSANNFKIKGRSSSVNFKTLGLGAFKVNISASSNARSYICVVTTNENVNATNVMISRHFKLFSYLLTIAKGDDKNTFIYQLKKYLENPLAYYGFAMTEQVTTNQFLIVKQSKYLTSNICQKNLATLKYLNDTAAKLKLKTTGELRLQYVSTVTDSTELMLGLVIKGERPTVKNLRYMQMAGNRVLVGSFKGKYKDRQNLYRALYLYMADHSMHQQTKPYETFKNNTLPTNDETIVDMQVIVPYV